MTYDEPRPVPDPPPEPRRRCRRCDSPDMEYRCVTSDDGGHDDDHYECRACGYEWWADGADA